MAKQPDGMNFLDEWLWEDGSGAAYYQAIQPTIPESLVSACNYARILKVASQVPGACALGGFYFELGLGETEARADISFRALPAYGGPTALAAYRPAVPWPGHDPWLILQRLASKWSQPGEPLHKAIAEVWLEFDIQGSRPETPSFFLTPAACPSLDQISLLKSLQAEIGDQVFSPAACGAVQTLVQDLPEKLTLNQIGFMSSRRPLVVRLCLGCPEWEIIRQYLMAADAAFDRWRSEAVLGRLANLADYFILHLDLDGTLRPKIGLDLLLNQANPRLEPCWGKLFDALRTMQLCIPAKQEALLQIYGYTPMGIDLIHWPPVLRQRFLESNFTEVSYLVRAVSHLKVVSEPGQDVCAKAYVSVNHCWNRK